MVVSNSMFVPDGERALTRFGAVPENPNAAVMEHAVDDDDDEEDGSDDDDDDSFFFNSTKMALTSFKG